MTDPIADMLTRIRNAVTAKHTRVDMPASRLKVEIAPHPPGRGLHPGLQAARRPADAAKGQAPVKTLRLFLKYGPHGEQLITGIERISRPGRRVYFGRDDVPDVLGGPRHEHPDDVARRHDRPRGRQGGRRRRSAL